MKTITQMRAEIKDLLEKMDALKAQVVNEKRDLNDDERKGLTEWLDTVEGLEKDIALQERLEKTEERNAKPTRQPDRVDPAKATPNIKVVEDRRKYDEFRSFGEQLRAVYQACTNQSFDPRLAKRASGMNEGVSTQGGFLVQPTFSSTLLENAWELAGLLPFMTKDSIAGNSMTIPAVDETSRVDGSRQGGVRGYWGAEAASMTSSKPKFREINLKVNKVHVLIYTTEEMLEDVSYLSSFINRVGPEEINFKITDAVINGDGAGKPLGILNSACLVSQAKDTSQTADTVTHTNIVNMWSRMPARSRMNAVWMINQDVEPQLNVLGFGNGTTDAIYMPPGGLRETPYAGYATLLGRPVVVLEQCATLGDAGDIILADMSKYIAVDKGGIQSAVSLHVRFIYDEQVFKFTYRFDGQPALASAITPFKGTKTLSPFVVVAART
jgi:HK97 family phage major capsid protein